MSFLAVLSQRLSPHFSVSLSILALALAAVTTGCRSQNAEATQDSKEPEETPFSMGEPITDPALAVIVADASGGDTLTTEEFGGHIERVLQQFPMFGGDPEQQRELRRTLIEQFVIAHALARQADASGLVVDYERVDREIIDIKARFDDEAAFQGALAQENMTEADLRDRLGEEIQRQLWQERIVEGVAQPSASDVEGFRHEQAEQVRAQHILFYSPAADSAVESRAQAVLDSAKSGVDFAELARRHSDDGSANEGGDLDYFSRADMVEPFSDAAFALRDSGDVANDVVRTQFGYHIIRLTGRRTGEPMSEESATQMLLQKRQQEALREAVDRLRSDVVVRVNPSVVQVDLNEPRG